MTEEPVVVEQAVAQESVVIEYAVDVIEEVEAETVTEHPVVEAVAE